MRSNWDYEANFLRKNILCSLSLLVSPSSVSRLLSARTLRRSGPPRLMVAYYIHGFSVPPSALRRSKVSHRLRLSMRERPGFVLHFPLSSSHDLFPSYSSSLSFLPRQDSRHRVMNIAVVARRSVSTIRRLRLTWPRYRLYGRLIYRIILLESMRARLGSVAS